MLCYAMLCYTVSIKEQPFSGVASHPIIGDTYSTPACIMVGLCVSFDLIVKFVSKSFSESCPWEEGVSKEQMALVVLFGADSFLS